jgi:hypothetical protein
MLKFTLNGCYLNSMAIYADINTFEVKNNPGFAWARINTV